MGGAQVVVGAAEKLEAAVEAEAWVAEVLVEVQARGAKEAWGLGGAEVEALEVEAKEAGEAKEALEMEVQEVEEAGRVAGTEEEEGRDLGEGLGGAVVAGVPGAGLRTQTGR